jgi:hypothetical protein
MKYLIFIGFLLMAMPLASQTDPLQTGSVVISQDARVDSLLKIRKQLNAEYSQLEGFRVQIFMESGNSAVQQAESIIRSFREEFPDVPAYLSFGQPYYRIRVGDFRNRIEAEGFLRNLIGRYNQAFVVKEIINLPTLKSFSIQNQDL